MRVLHVISSLDPRAGGPSSALLGLATAQARAGLRVAVAGTWSQGESTTLADQMSAGGVSLRLIGPCGGKLKRHPDLGRVILDSAAAADVIHIHALWEEIQHQAARTAGRRGVPYIFRPCGMLDPWSLAQSRWKKRLYLAWRLRRDLNEASLLHFTSQTERDLTRPLKLRSPSAVIPNGVQLEEFENLPPRGGFRPDSRRSVSARWCCS